MVPPGSVRAVATGARAYGGRIKMQKMCDGSDRIPDGSYVRVAERLPEGAGREARHYIGRIAGTDMGCSKYQVGVRYAGWGKWLFTDDGAWAFPREVTVISEAEALAHREVAS